MKGGRFFFTILFVSLFLLGLFFVYGYCQGGGEIPVTEQSEASPYEQEPPEPEAEPDEPEEEDEAIEIKSDTEDTFFRFGGTNIRLMLIQPTPLFATELFSVPEEGR